MKTLLSCLLLLGVATSLHAQFIVPDHFFRCPASETACVGLPAHENRVSPAGNAFVINYVEYKDSGEPRKKPRELEDAVAEVGTAIGEDRQGKALVVVYIHGWQNNADEPPGCQDVCRFRDTLLPHLADAQAESGHPLKVVGIYLAWRGLTFTKEPFKHGITYWHRRAIARNEGETGMYDAVTEIEQAVHPYRKNYVLVFAGHSFGARVLEHAVDTEHNGRPGFMLEYRRQRKTLVAKQAAHSLTAEDTEHLLNPELPVDLVLYINAATSSRVARQTLNDIHTICKKENDPICNADPFYVAVTSRADWATGILMPIANAIFPSLPADRYWLISAANSPSLHTHNIDKPCNAASDLLCFPVLSAVPSYQEGIAAIPGKEQVAGRHNHPFWIFNVGSEVINSHGVVWNLTVTDLVTNIITRHPRFQALSKIAP